jgi:hypothetical protein
MGLARCKRCLPYVERGPSISSDTLCRSTETKSISLRQRASFDLSLVGALKSPKRMTSPTTKNWMRSSYMLNYIALEAIFPIVTNHENKVLI